MRARWLHVGSARSCCPTSSLSVVSAVTLTTPNLGSRDEYKSTLPDDVPCQLQLLPRILECLQRGGTRRRRRATILDTGARTVASANTAQYPSSVSCSTNGHPQLLLRNCRSNPRRKSYVSPAARILSHRGCMQEDNSKRSATHWLTDYWDKHYKH